MKMFEQVSMFNTGEHDREVKKDFDKLTMEEIFSDEDKDGNKLIVDVVDPDKRGYLYLKLKSESRRREIGMVYRDQPEHSFTYAKTVIKERHLFKRFNAWGMCWAVIQRLGKKGRVEIVDDSRNRYRLPADLIRPKGKFRYFKDIEHGGFELQIFVPLEEWN